MLQKDSCFDVIIIGAGVAGCCLARELSRFDLRCLVLEAGNDVAFATSRANSGIVHAGYDPTPGSLKAQYCARGARMFAEWADELEFGYRETGSLVLAFSDDELATLRILQERADQNGVTVELLGAQQVQELEPEVSSSVIAALYAPHAGICDPYGLTFAAAEHAAEQGVTFYFEERVIALEQTEGGFTVTTAAGNTFCCRLLVNAAGVFADEIHNMLSAETLSITPVRGEYMLYDTPYGSLFSHVLFQAPGALGKGVLIAPTIHGNMLIGPNAIPQESKIDVSTSAEGLENVLAHAQKTWPQARQEGVIANFAGLRAKGAQGDFVIGEVADIPGFFDIACFESPGLTAAPAVAVDLALQLSEALGAHPRASFCPYRKRRGHKLFALMNADEQEAAMAAETDEGHVVCRCCNVTRADIVFELEATLPVLSMDTLKWRTGILMGRCHGGFCAPELMSIMYEYTGLAPEELDKRLPDSPFVLQSSAAYHADATECEDTTKAGIVSGLAMGAQPSPVLATNAASRQDIESCLDSATAASSKSDNLSSSLHPEFDVLVIGAGAAGMAAAQEALKEGAERVALLDREGFLGGILRQCIHNGFGLTRFKKELTGPEYASREAQALRQALENNGIHLFLNTMVLSLTSAHDASGLYTITAASADGLLQLKAKALVLATGSRERGQGALNLAGSRPAGVYSAGSAQNLINLKGCLPGRKVVIQGSGDIGLIMARRCLFSGAEVLGVLARSSEPSGLRRNVRQCLDDFNIPFYGNSLITRLEGEGRLEAVWVSKVDPATKQVIDGSAERWSCDTLLLSIGLIPENELAVAAGIAVDTKSKSPHVDSWLQTSAPGVFVCGNSLHIHDLADSASAEGERAGRFAARFALGRSLTNTPPHHSEHTEESLPDASSTRLTTQAVTCHPERSEESSASVNMYDTMDPSHSSSALDSPDALPVDTGFVSTPPDAYEPTSTIPFEPDLVLTCVRCPKGCELSLKLAEDGSVDQVVGEGCKLGLAYAHEEVTAPTRIVTASLPVANSFEPLSVKTAKPVPRSSIFEVLREVNKLQLCSPIAEGTVLSEDIAQTGVALVATKSV